MAERVVPWAAWSVLLMCGACPGTVTPDAGSADAGGPDASLDGGAPDAREGVDAGLDAGLDAGVDAGPSVDAGPFACPAVGAGVSEGTLGADQDTVEPPLRRVVLMGGSVEVDAASTLFVDGAMGGDVLVLRASGSTNSYTPYFYDELPVDNPPASVTTLRVDEPSASGDEGLLCQLKAAEAVWFAGGDQYDYLGRWRPALHKKIRELVLRDATVGGTSAGAMALSAFSFDAAAGSVVSDEALADPFDPLVSVVPSPMAQPELADVIVDTHFTARNREGRLLTFLARARLLAPEAPALWGVGLDERASLVIEDGGYQVLTGAPDRAVWLYRYAGAPTLSAGEPVTLDEDVLRLRLDHGASGPWPLPAAAWDDAAALTVTAGSVQVTQP